MLRYKPANRRLAQVKIGIHYATDKQVPAKRSFKLRFLKYDVVNKL
jgi:hypothetical protein